MQAIGFQTPGGPDVLEVIELSDLQVKPDEVLIRVRAATVNPTDLMRRSGARTADKSGPFVPGMDVAGVIEAIGADAETELDVGDEVMAIVVPDGAHGAYAERVALPASSVTRIPAGASIVEAATLPMNGLTARLALDTLDLPAGSTIAVTGSVGALGGYVVQLAKADGLTVIADAAEADEALVRSLGADEIVRRGAGFSDAVRELRPDGVDGIVDGALQLEEIVGAAADGAKIITIRGTEGEQDRGVTFTPILVVAYAREHEKLETLRQQATDGLITLRVAEALPKEQAPRAHERLEAGGVRGRLVLEF